MTGVTGCDDKPNKTQKEQVKTPTINPGPATTVPPPAPDPETEAVLPPPEPEPVPAPVRPEKSDTEDVIQANKPSPDAPEVVVKPHNSLDPGSTEVKGTLDREGSFLETIPDSMQVNKRETVEVRISRSLSEKSMKRLKSRLPSSAEPQIDTIITGEIMDVQLSEYDTTNRKFRIIPQQVSEQILDTNDLGAWSWSVTPLVAGKHTLIIRVKNKQYSGQFNTEGYQYIPVWEKEVEVMSNGEIMASGRPVDIPESYETTDKPFNRIVGGDPMPASQEDKPSPWLLGGIIGALVSVLVIFFLRKSKNPVFVKPPPIPKEKLDAIDELIKKDKLETALDALETLVIVVRDKEHNQLIAYQAELESYEKKYKGGEIKFEDYSIVRARIRTALIEMNDRLTEGG